MKIKISLLISVFYLGFTANSQTFPYVKDWGSYVGGNGTVLQDLGYDETSIQVDNQKNIYTKGSVMFQSGYNASYYNQFVNGGGNTITAPTLGAFAYYETKFSPQGQMLKGSYISSGSISDFTYKRLTYIDSSNNFYYINRYWGSVPNLATAGTWLQNPASSANFTYTLSKYDGNQNLLWTTYLPSTAENLPFLRGDENGNIYFVGAVNTEIAGLSNSGVFQEHYINYSTTSDTSTNSVIVKFNPFGQKIWGTYSVLGIQDMEIYNNGLYMFGGNINSNMPNNYITSGTFQPNTPSIQIISKFDGDTGQKVWGTYYGTPSITSYSGLGIYDLEVNETGLYLSGHTNDAAYPDYFATPGAFKNQLTGDGDLFLSKFDYTGNRVWSTYFGSNGDDEIIGSPNLSILGNRIVMTGNQFGNTDNISTPNAYLTTPSNAVSNMYFTEFDADGNRKWSSYYGGSGGTIYGEQLNPKFLNDGSLILWGTTGASTGIGTPGASYPAMTNPGAGMPFGFIAKFSLKEPQLGTSDIDKATDLKLYDNPNNGKFYITGSILEKQNSGLKIFDLSGRLLKQISLDKKKTHEFNMQNELSKGNYLLEISSEKNERIKTFKMSVK